MNTFHDILIDWNTNRNTFHKIVFMDENGIYVATPLGIGFSCCTVGMAGGAIRTISPNQVIGTAD